MLTIYRVSYLASVSKDCRGLRRGYNGYKTYLQSLYTLQFSLSSSETNEAYICTLCGPLGELVIVASFSADNIYVREILDIVVAAPSPRRFP